MSVDGVDEDAGGRFESNLSTVFERAALKAF